MDSYTDNMPFRNQMNPDINPLMPGSTVPLEILEEDKTIIEGMYGNLLDKRYNPLIDGSTVDAQPCGHGDTECERRAYIRELRSLGAQQDEIDTIMGGYQNDSGCHECSC